MEYGRIINRAASITWRHKILWIFGIALTLFSGGTGGGGVQRSFDSGDTQALGQAFPFLNGQMPNWEAIWPILLGILGIVLVFGIVWTIVGVIVRYTSEGALIGMVDEVEATETTSFRGGLNRGWQRLLRLFAIDLLIGVGTALVVVALVLLAILGGGLIAALAAMLSQAGEGAGTLGIILGVLAGIVGVLLLIAIALALSAAVTLLREYAFRASVLDHMGVFDSLGAAWRMARANLKESLLMWLLLGLIGLVIGLVTIPIAILALGLIAAPAAALYALTESGALAALIAVPILLAFILVAIAVSGVVRTFVSAVWTLVYRELRAPRPVEVS
ncbi:MAG: DUF7544 domain-containing protein [Anaerolineae bacterium]